MGVISRDSVDSFFREAVVEALDHQEVEATEHAEYYLVSLLSEFSRTSITDEPLGMKLVQGTQGTPEQRFRTLKQVGDTSLYVTGFFCESLERKLVDATYYIGLGEAAYTELACQLSGPSAFQQVYGELADKFPQFVEVLQLVRSRVSCAGKDVGQLYEEWLRTRSSRVEDRLRELGVIMDGNGALH
jgi:hypothetical protein